MAQCEILPMVGNKLTSGQTDECDAVPVRKLVKDLGSQVLDKSFPTSSLLLSSRWLKTLSKNPPAFYLFYLHSDIDQW